MDLIKWFCNGAFLEFKGKLTPEQLMANRGVLLFICISCGRQHDREFEPQGNGALMRALNCSCEEASYEYCQDSWELLCLNGVFGWKKFFQTLHYKLKCWWAK